MTSYLGPYESQFIILSGLAMYGSSHENRKRRCDLTFEACKKFVNKESISFGTGDVDDNVLGTTVLYSPITTKKHCIDNYFPGILLH